GGAGPVEDAVLVVPDLADVGAALLELGAGGGEVRDDQVQPSHGAGRRVCEVLAEDNRGGGTGRRELYDAQAALGGEVGVVAPAEPLVEGLGAVDVRDGQDDYLELELHGVSPVSWVSCGWGDGVLSRLQRTREGLAEGRAADQRKQ